MIIATIILTLKLITNMMTLCKFYDLKSVVSYKTCNFSLTNETVSDPGARKTVVVSSNLLNLRGPDF